jgi:hypothetical protein
MRFLKLVFYLACLVLVIVGGLYFWPAVREGWDHVRTLRGASDKVSAARISLAYELSEDRWTEFVVQARATRFKVVTNADIAPGAVNATDRLGYSIAFQVVGEDDTVLQEGVYHHLTRLTLYHDPLTTDGFQVGAFYLDRTAVPMDGRVFFLDLDHVQTSGTATTVRLRLAGIDPRMQDMVVRAYELLPNPENKLDQLWSGLSRTQREKAARGNVYPQDFLEPGEKRNLMRVSWHPLGPQGIPNKDYVLRRMYVLKDLEGLEVQEPPLPVGPVADAGLRFTLPVPEEGMRVAVRFVPLEPLAGQVAATVKWYGRSLRERETLSVSVRANGGELNRFFPGGLIECISPVPVRIVVMTGKDGDLVPVEPEPLYQRGFVATGDTPVRYDLVPGRTGPVPMRLRFRLPGGGANLPEISVRLVDGAGTVRKTLRPGRVDWLPSLYDRIVGDPDAPIPSDPESRYLRVPNYVDHVEIASTAPVLVDAAIRPSGLPRRINVPEDGYRMMDEDTLRQPAWFPIYPRTYRTRYGRGDSILLKVQYRPPEDDPDLLAQRYLWESFRPRGRWQGGEVVVPVEESLRVRNESLSARFVPLGSRERTLELRRSTGDVLARPTVLYVGADLPAQLQVVVDGREVFATRLSTARGTLRLPRLEAGRHVMKILASAGMETFVNQVASSEKGVVRRFGYCLENPLSFPVHKRTNGQEIVNLEFYSKGGERTEITTRIKGATALQARLLPELTIRERVFSVRPGTGTVPVLQGKIDHLRSAESMLLFLGEDLPPGTYVLEITRTGGPAGYVAAYRVIPGEHSRRRIFHE